MTPIDLMDDLFCHWFEGNSWAAWRAVLKSLFALPLDLAELKVYTAATGRTLPPSFPVSTAWICCGRRGGKSLVSALVAVYLACFRDYSQFLAPGEAAVVMCVGADRKQARVLFRFIRAFIVQTPMLAALVVRQTRDTLELSNRVIIEVHTASFRSVRGYTLAGVINDEICFWNTDEESADPDVSIIEAQRPSLATIPGALMLNISSPYARRGSMYAAYEAHYGKDTSDVLFWKAPSRALPEQEVRIEMNPTIDISIVEQAYADDSVAASAEWGANFRSDVEQMFNLEMLEKVTDYGRPEILPPCFEEEAP